MSTSDLLPRLKPLRGAHWLLSLAIVASAMLLLFAGQCPQGLAVWQAAWLTAVIAIVVWTNHLRVAPIRSIRSLLLVLARSAWELVKLVAAFALVALPLAVVTPAVSCLNDRAKTAVVLLGTSAQRSEIAERILQRGSVVGAGQGMVFAPSAPAEAGLIQSDGSMVILSDNPPTALVLVPSIDAAGTVQWTCKGFPEKAIPLPCKQPKP